MQNHDLKIAIADDHTILRKTLADALVFGSNLNVAYHVGNGAELLFELERELVDAIILDLDMPVMSGGQALKIIREKYPQIKVIILSMHNDEAIVAEYFRRGVNAFLPKDCDIEDLIDAIYETTSREFYFLDDAQKELIADIIQYETSTASNKKISLSEREIEIIRLICLEKCTREIAVALKITERTVENHRYHISKKIGTSNGIGMLVYALLNGIAKITAEGKVVFD